MLYTYKATQQYDEMFVFYIKYVLKKNCYMEKNLQILFIWLEKLGKNFCMLIDMEKYHNTYLYHLLSGILPIHKYNEIDTITFYFILLFIHINIRLYIGLLIDGFIFI